MDIETVLKNHAIDIDGYDWDIDNLDKQQIDDDAIIHWVARNGTVEEMECLISNSASIEVRGDIGKTALMESIDFGNFEVAKFLLSIGADVLAKDDYEDSVLDSAEISKNIEIVTLVREHINKTL
jgi:ankyrin repeat protein